RTSKICRRRGSATALNASAVVAARAMLTSYANIGICQEPDFRAARVGVSCSNSTARCKRFERAIGGGLQMAWKIKAKYYEACNCALGCPCNMNGFPTHGFCEGSIAFQ